MPIATAEASVSSMEIWEKYGRHKTEVSVIFFFIVVKVISADVHHDNLVELNKSVRGVAREE